MQSRSDDISPDSAFHLGRYRLKRVLGRGAMGEVWAADTALVDQEVAVKVALEHDPTDPWAGRALDNEVATAAHLDHPGIVAVLDHGRVDLVAHTASDGRLPVGGPFVVMQLLHGRSLHEFIGRLSWPEVREVLRQLLDALGHCHARGVIHRDLKPGNVVVEAAGPTLDRPLRVTLMDFGLARFLGRPAGHEENVAGTPAYMAPEQLQGSWRVQGPWTDLYSVGCLGWTLVTGAPPFGRRRSYEEFLDDHLHLRPPPLDPMIGVPVAVEDWLLELLAKSPRDRFRCAADARAALDLLPSGIEADAPTIEPVAPPIRVGGRDEDSSFGELSLDDLLSTANLRGKGQADAVFEDDTRDTADPPEDHDPLAAWSEAVVRAPAPRARLPAGWRQPRAVLRHPLDGGGLSVFGLRAPPLVGRQRERDQMWSVLLDAEETGRPWAIVLRGATGTGKSRLAAWLCETAYELAGVENLRATWSETQAADGGLAAMFRRRLGVDGLPTDDVPAHLRAVLSAHLSEETELEALVSALAPPSTDPREPVRFASPRERRVLFTRLASWLATRPAPGQDQPDRGGLLWLDDAHFSPESVDFTTHVLDHASGPPLVVLLTVAELPRAGAERWAQLIDHERCLELRVEPLPPTDHRVLVDSLLRFDPSLAATLTERTGGNPQFAVSLVADWVSRGVLVPGPAGFLADAEAVDRVPGDPLAMWHHSFDAAYAALTDDQQRALELAAVLGDRVDAEEWRAVCVRSRIRPQPELVDVWVRLHLLHRHPGGFVFAHPVVREALQHAAATAGRAARHHRLCATIVELRAPAGPATSGRVARHLLAAGDTRDALDYLLLAARGHAATGQADQVTPWLELWEATAATAGVAAGAPERVQVWSLRLDALWLTGAPEHAPATAALFDQAEHRRELRGLAALHRALGYYQHGEFGSAESELRRAADYAASDPHLTTRIALEQGRLALESGDLDGARERLETARGHAVRARDLRAEATSAWLLGRIEKQAGDLQAAHVAFTRAATRYERAQDRNGLARCTNELGEIARLEGSLDTAQAHYREALGMMERLGSDNTDIVRFNLGLVLLAAGRHTEARPVLETAAAAFRSAGRLALLATAQVALLPCAATDGRWAEWDTRLLAASRDLRKSRFVDLDLALLLEAAARVAVSVGQPLRADAALALAEAQWSALDRPDDLARVSALRSAP